MIRSGRKVLEELWEAGERDRNVLAKRANLTPNTIQSYLSMMGLITRQGPRESAHSKVLKLWADGERDYDFIAKKAGCARSSVKVYLCHAGLTNDPSVTLYTTRVHVPYALIERARAMNIAPSSLIHRILKAVDEGDLYKAVLDDEH